MSSRYRRIFLNLTPKIIEERIHGFCRIIDPMLLQGKMAGSEWSITRHTSDPQKADQAEKIRKN